MKMTRLVISALAIACIVVVFGCSNSPTSPSSMQPDAREPAGTAPPTSGAPSPTGTSSTDESPKTDTELSTIEMFEGSWKVDAIEFRGESQTPDAGMPETIKIIDGVFNAFSAGTPMPTFSEMKMSLKQSTSPIELDLVRKRNDRLESLPCIAELNGQQLKIAMPMLPAKKSADESLNRPESFDTNSGPFMVLTATRMQ